MMRRLVFLFVILALILVACTDSGGPTTAPALELPQLYEGTMVDGSAVSVNYPVDWGMQVTVPDFGIAFAFPESLIDSVSAGTMGTFEAGQAQIFVIFSAKSDLAAVLEDHSASGLLESFLSNIDSSTGTVGTIEAKTIDGREAASVLLSESTGDTYAVVIDAGDAYVVLTGTFASGDLAQYQASIEAMAASARYTSMVEEATAEATEAQD